MPEKKKPGRPKKTQNKPNIKCVGITDEPDKAENIVEFVYMEPMLFKRALSIFQSMTSSVMTFDFTPTELTITGKDHFQKSEICVSFRCSALTRYYCAERITLTLNTQNMEKITRTIDKNYSVVNIIIKRGSPSVLFIFQNDIKIDEMVDVKTIPNSDVVPAKNIEYKEYPISLELSSKYFKKLIMETATFSEKLAVRKIGLGPLLFAYISNDKTVSSQYVVKEPEQVDLKSMIGPEDVFSVSIQLDYIKSYSSLTISEMVQIYIHDTKKIIFMNSLDEGIVQVQVATSIAQAPPR